MGKWYDQAVFYHIYPLGMTGAPLHHQEEGVTHRFEQIYPWIDHIQDLGCTAIYIGPLFESSTHGYDTMDYKKVDRRLGDNEDFKKFVRICHEKGIKVIVDGVFNHTGRDFFAFQDIKSNRENSPYLNWYCNVNLWGNNEFNDGFSYDNWGGCNILAKLNQRNPEVKDYIYDIIRFWVSEFDIDGIRLDAADVLEFDFMKGIRNVANQVKEDFWLMGEVIHGDYSRWVNPEMLHSTTNYELHKGLYSGHNDHNYFEIAHTIRRQFDSNGGIYRGLKLYTFVDNHDVERIVSKLSNKEHAILTTILLFTLPGIPSIYYGSEWGIEGKKERGNDDSLRPALNLEQCIKENPYPKLTEYIKKMGQLYKESSILTEGSYKELLLTNRQYAFARIQDQKAVITAVNNDDNPAKVSIPVPVNGTLAVNYLTGEELIIDNGRINLSIKENDGVIIKIN